MCPHGPLASAGMSLIFQGGKGKDSGKHCFERKYYLFSYFQSYNVAILFCCRHLLQYMYKNPLQRVSVHLTSMFVK